MCSSDLANAFAEDIAASREAGMNEHLTKPLDVTQLIAVMSRRLKEKPETLPAVDGEA